MRNQRALSLSLNSFVVKDGRGDDFHMSQFRRVPVVLIVNVASHCEYTDRHYRELQALRADYAEEKLAMIAFPSNQFGGCEPGTWQEIVSFARRHYGVTFPIMAKVNINGHQSDPLFAWLKAASGHAVHVPWNFTKFLVMGGDIVKRYSHDVSVKEIERDITGALDACPDFGCEP